MKKFSLVAAAAVVAGAMLVPTASAEVPKDVFETELKDVRNQSCQSARERGYGEWIASEGVKTRNDLYAWSIKKARKMRLSCRKMSVIVMHRRGNLPVLLQTGL